MEYVDLSQPIRSGTRSYPGDPVAEVTPHATFEEDGFRVTNLSLGSHTGTHVDGPSHLLADGKSLDDFPIDAFAFEAVRISATNLDAREAITCSHFPSPPEADLVAIHTGWDEHWNTDAYFDHSYLDPELATWLAKQGYHVGIDAPSVDPTPTARAGPDELSGYPAHHELLGSDRLLVENLTGLADLPSQFTLVAFPLSISAVDGAPVRAVARLDG